VPELVQEDASAPRLAAEVKAILSDRERRDAIRSELAEIRHKLGEPGAARRAAELAVGLMKTGAGGKGPRVRAEGEKT
jgi:lipid-A-disaccharide synthase